MWSSVVKRLGTMSWGHSLAEFVNAHTRQTFSTRKGRTNAGDTLWVMLWISTRVPAKCPSCAPPFAAVAPKQRAPDTVHRTWRPLPHAACAEAQEQESGGRGPSEPLTHICRRGEVRLARQREGQTGGAH